MTELRELLDLAVSAAAEAGAALKGHRAEWGVIEAEQGREVKVQADRKAEALILPRLAETLIPILSEETGWVGKRTNSADYAWVLDPLDGSVNYLRGFPQCAVSIALLRNNVPVLGVVECFMVGELFSGIVNEGAYVNGVSMSVSRIDHPNKGVLHTGLPARASSGAIGKIAERLHVWQKVRMIGTAATALAHVAAGRAEAYRESGSMIWDVAAGCALVQAAGGEFFISDGPLDAPLEVAAANGRVPLPN